MWSCCWFWLFLVASANGLASGQRPLAPTCRVKGHVKAQLTVHCGDGVHAGAVRFWHTPFGDLRAPGLGSELDPVFMRLDGSLVVPNSSRLHSGLYYCLLQHTHGTTLWPYLLQVGQDQDQEDGGGTEPGRGGIRIRRSSRSEEAERGVSDGDLAAAVSVSVLLTFVFGFSAGALSRTRVLRCLETLSRKVPLLRQRRRRHPEDEDIPVYEDLALGPAPGHVTMETRMSPSASCPPVKPQRSFRVKREEVQESAAYLEGCDPKTEEEEKKKGEEERREGLTGGGEGEEQGLSRFYLGVDGGSQGETDVDGVTREEDEKKRGEEEETEGNEEEEPGPSGFYLGVDGENREEERGSEQETEGKEEEERDETEGERDKDNCQHEAEESTSPPGRSRRSRVLRLYQYDEDGHLYAHLPGPAPELPGPAPRPKQRSRSLNRLSSIMAAASAGPLDEGGPRGPEGGGARFHMEI